METSPPSRRIRLRRRCRYASWGEMMLSTPSRIRTSPWSLEDLRLHTSGCKPSTASHVLRQTDRSGTDKSVEAAGRNIESEEEVSSGEDQHGLFQPRLPGVPLACGGDRDAGRP